MAVEFLNMETTKNIFNCCSLADKIKLINDFRVFFGDDLKLFGE